MRKINKGEEPPSLSAWKRANPQDRYGDLSSEVKQDIRSSCITEQFSLCAYCCTAISASDGSCHNEHVEAQSRASNRTLDHTNIVASCNKEKRCGKAHKAQALPLTPLMDECESELKFYMSGRVEGVTDRAKESIRALNLGDNYQNNRDLVETRKQFVDAIIYQQGATPEDITLLDEELLQMIVEDISVPQDGKLLPFSPVLVNILRDLLAA